ncbi:MAG: serine/threonine-protein kinase [Bdellovibrionota bacterium]
MENQPALGTQPRGRATRRRSLLERLSDSFYSPQAGLRAPQERPETFYQTVSLDLADEPRAEERLPDASGGLFAGRYYLRNELGCGGMGRVYRAQDADLGDETIAIKILHPQYSRDSRFRSRFIREVKLMRTITSVHIVRTFDVGMSGDDLFLTMEYVEGVSLAKLMYERDLTVQQKIQIARAICVGLVSIHEKNIIHRDIKPANILVESSGGIKIADFGLARPLSSELTMANEIMGSLSYVAPELVIGHTPTLAVDLYSFGVVLYELFTGRVPFETPSFYALMRMHVEQPPVAPSMLDTNLPENLSRLIMRLLEKDPLLRPSSVEEVFDELSAEEDRVFAA